MFDRPAGVLIGFASGDDRFDHQLENDPRFLRRVETARKIFGRVEEYVWKIYPIDSVT